MNNQKIRNVAIIAHVDHGKTTLVDAMLKQSGIFRANEQVEERVMDSNDLEKERGITILSKNTAVHYKDYKINIVDTPGHADFGGEVERVLKMVDGVVLLVDSFEGAMPQTREVLKKSLALNLKPIVVINKIDRPGARPEKVVDEVLELFIELDANDDQLDFPVVYASGKQGTATMDLNVPGEDLQCLFETIVNTIEAPNCDLDGTAQMLVSNIEYDDYVGRIAIGRIERGSLKLNMPIAICKKDKTDNARVTKLYTYEGLKRIEVEEAGAGDIVALSGVTDINIGDTICDYDNPEKIPFVDIDEPTVSMTFSVNNGPLAGREGQFITSRHLRDRLFKELEKNVSLRVKETDRAEAFEVSGRGELHLSILIENLRREGFELQVSKPEVIIKEIDGVKCEPYEEVQIEVPEESVGNVIESLGLRGAKMENMANINNLVRLIYTIPSRGLIGFSTDFMTMTKGYGIINHSFKEYLPVEDIGVGERKLGVLVSMENGKATAYAIGNLEDRGTMFIEPGTEVYEGMIVGECNRENDLAVNVVKGKQLTNTRAAGSDHTVVLKRPRPITLEYCLDYINSDELLEVTPHFLRLRKKILNTESRKKFDAKKNV